jgi:hypothetical protein
MSALYGRILTLLRIHPKVSLCLPGVKMFSGLFPDWLRSGGENSFGDSLTLLETVARRLLLDDLSGREDGEEESICERGKHRGRNDGA